MCALRSAWPWFCGGAALVAANAALVFNSVNEGDESWTLQVVHRVAGGEALYGDIQFGATPLSIYLLWAVVGVVGQQILAVKALSAFFAAGSGLLVARVSHQAGATWFGAAVCAALTVPLAPRYSSSLYTPLAMLLFLACESMVFSIQGRPGLARAGAAGGLAGLSFAAKQNVGGLAVVALVAAIIVAEPSRAEVRRALAAVATFAAVALITVGGMVATGGVRNALDALGLGKGAYLEHGTILYHDTLRDHLNPLRNPDTWANVITGHDRDLLLASPAVILPVVTALLLVAAWAARWSPRRPRELDRQLTTVTLFAVAAFLAAFPRYDGIHLAWIAGPLLAACAASLSRVVRAPGRAFGLAITAAAVAWVAFALVGPIDDWRSGNRVRVGLPHFAGGWMAPHAQKQAAAAARRFQETLPGHRVLLVIPNASFFYLAARLEDPTRYDYPATTTIGTDATNEILTGVAEGTIPAVCLDDAPPDPAKLPLFELERRLRHALRPGPDVGPCRLWLPRHPGNG